MGTQHLISYYLPADVAAGRLRAPSSLPELASLEIAEGLLERGNFRWVGRLLLLFPHTPPILPFALSLSSSSSSSRFLPL
ncbi:hypothetical protein B0H11DRAFT_1700790 [Mycena galericulata]|nr:hypothetical protein B0H11DRAFT_1700790 [Mycena galericulata]